MIGSNRSAPPSATPNVHCPTSARKTAKPPLPKKSKTTVPAPAPKSLSSSSSSSSSDSKLSLRDSAANTTAASRHDKIQKKKPAVTRHATGGTVKDKSILQVSGSNALAPSSSSKSRSAATATAAATKRSGMASKSKKGGAAARPSLGARGFDVAKYEGDPAKLTVAQLRAVLGYAGIQLPMNTVKKAALVRQFEELQTKLRMSQTGQELGEDDEPNDIEEVELSQCTPLIVSKRCSVRSDKKLRRLNFEGNAPELPKNTDPMRTGDSSDPVTITTQHPPLATPRRAVPSTPSHQIKVSSVSHCLFTSTPSSASRTCPSHQLQRGLQISTPLHLQTPRRSLPRPQPNSFRSNVTSYPQLQTPFTSLAHKDPATSSELPVLNTHPVIINIPAPTTNDEHTTAITTAPTFTLPPVPSLSIPPLSATETTSNSTTQTTWPCAVVGCGATLTADTECQHFFDNIPQHFKLLQQQILAGSKQV